MKSNITPVVVGLLVAFGGPAVLLSPADRLLGPPERLMTKLLEQLMLWVLLAIIVAIVIFWERRPLASMWLRPFAWQSIAWGLLFAAATIYVVMPILTRGSRTAGIPGFEAGMAKILVLPVWLRVVAVVTAGIVKDALFLGYAFTRLTILIGKKWLSGIITVALVSLLHFPHWGSGPALAYLAAVGLAVAFFVWRRDLLANIVAHVTVDGMGLVIVPVLSHFRMPIVSTATLLCLPLSALAQTPTLRAHLQHTFRHTNEVMQVAFSPDSQILASSSVDHTVRLWRVADAKLIRTLTHPEGITSIDFSRDGQWLVSGSYDRAVRIWRVRDGSLARTLTGHGGTVWTVAFSPDGQRVASAGEDKVVKVWRVIDGALLKSLTGHTLNIWRVAFSPDGQRLASSSFDKTIRMWRADTGALLQTLTGHKEAVVGLAFSPDGQWLASGGDDSTIRIWRAKDGRLTKTLTDDLDHVYCLAFSPDSRWLVSGGRGQGNVATLWKQIAGYRMSSKGKTIRLWRVSDGALQQTLAGHDDDVRSVALSPDGKWLASGSEDKTAKLWRLENR